RHDRRVPEEPARLVARVVRRAIRVREVIPPDGEPGPARTRAGRPARTGGGQGAGGRPNEHISLPGGGDLRPVDRALVVAHVDALEGGGRRGWSWRWGWRWRG